MKVGKILYDIVLGILILVFVVSAVYVGNYFYRSSVQQGEFDNLASLVEDARNASDGTSTTPSGASSEGSTETPAILGEYQAIYEMNDHLVGWIQIDGTSVNYPVMQTATELNFYLHRNFNREDSERGCIYVREDCDVFTPSDNVTIYGHHMMDGTMFHDLDSYLRRDFWEAHDTIRFDTLYEHHTYRIFAVFRTTATLGEGFTYHRFVNAADREEFEEFISTCRELSLYDTGIIPVYGDKIICLSTCEYTVTNGRLVVAAVRIDETT